MIVTVVLEEEDFRHLHDAIYDIYDIKPSNELIQKVWDKMPDYVQSEAIHWGTSDSVFQDEYHEWLSEITLKE